MIINITAAQLPSDEGCGHLADCRAGALRLPTPHAYESLIDVEITPAELRTLAARTDVSDRDRQGARETLAYDLAEIIKTAETAGYESEGTGIIACYERTCGAAHDQGETFLADLEDEAAAATEYLARR